MKLRGLGWRLKHRVFGARDKPHVPDFAEPGLVSALVRHVGSNRRGAPGTPTTRHPGEGRDPVTVVHGGDAQEHRIPDTASRFRDDEHHPSFHDTPVRGTRADQALAFREDVTRYFEHRTTPAFFADAQTLRALADGMASRHPEWRARLLAIVGAERTEGLKIYGMTGPVLRPGFPWGGLASEPNNDDLYSIRPHRFGFAPRHALAILYGEQPPTALAEVIEDWMAFAARGASEWPYCSALVVIQRLLALSWAHAFVTALPEPVAPAVVRLHADILQVIRADVEFLLPRLGKSAPNNHLLADRFAAWYIRLLYPEFVPGPLDLDVHEAIWLAELERQVYPDGTGFEHSLHYHEFGCEMASAYLLLSRRNARPVPAATLERVERMLDFQAGLAGPGCVTLPFGDATEDPLFGLDTGDGWATAGLRELYRALFESGQPPAPAMTPSIERAFWLLGGSLAPPPADPATPQLAPKMWPDGGFCVLADESNRARLVFRTGPTPHEELIAGHMHADLLSVCVTHGDQPVLVDPGTWCYRWRAEDTGPGRAYFSGPAAHNGLVLDGIDPLGPVRGDFRGKRLPVRVSTTRHLPGSRLAWVEAEVRGAAPYAGHRRGVVHVAGMYWLIYDRLPTDVEQLKATLGFQAAAGVAARQDQDGTAWLEGAGEALWLAHGPGLDDPRIVRGQAHPPGGWVAPQYGEQVPAAQLRYDVSSGATSTALALGAGKAPARPTAIHTLRTGLVIEIEGPQVRDLLVLATHDEDIRVDTPDAGGWAQALWVRTRDGQTERVRCLGFRETGSVGKPPATASRHGATEPMFGGANGGREVECVGPESVQVAFSGKVWR